MRFLWFGKKKQTVLAPDVEVVREPQEFFSVTGFVAVASPMGGSKNTELSHQFINSVILTLLSQEHSPAALAAQEYFQESGANLLPLRDYSNSSERGISGRVEHDGTLRTVLIGPAATIARATTPFASEITEAVSASPEVKVVAIDGIAYAAYSISREVM